MADRKHRTYTTADLKAMKSQTDWARVARDERAGKNPIVDSDDTEPTMAELGTAKRKRGERGPQKSPTKVLVSLRLDREVLGHFKSAGSGWQTRINDALASSVKGTAGRAVPAVVGKRAGASTAAVARKSSATGKVAAGRKKTAYK